MSAKTLVIGAAALMASGVAVLPVSADTPQQTAQPTLRGAVMFNLLDRDGDGVIGVDEANAVTAAILKVIDGDGDGKLTKEELGAARKLMRGAGAPGFDRGHGRYDMHRGADGHRFGGHYGRGAAYQGMGPGSGMMGPFGDEKGDKTRGEVGQMMGQSGQMMGPGGPGGRVHDFASIDTNGDGSISQEEFDAAVATFPGMKPAK